LARKINRKLFFTLKIVYIIPVLLYSVIAIATPQTESFRTFQGGVIEILLLVTSIVLLHNLKIKFALISGILGTIILGIEVFYSANAIGWYGASSWLQQTIVIDVYSGHYFINPICWLTILCVNIILSVEIIRDRNLDLNKIKKRITELSVDYTRLEIKAISEKLNQDPALIVKVIRDMVEKQEIVGVYFKSTKTITLNQEVNIDNINQLTAKRINGDIR